MKKRKVILLTLILAFTAILFVGCTNFKSQIDPEVHNCVVTIHANGGEMNEMEVRTFYVETGSPLPIPKTTGTVIIQEPARANHTIVGYFRVELDENGEFIWGEEWDFQWDHVESDMMLAVKWSRNVTYEFSKGTLMDGSALPTDFAFANVAADLVQSVPTNGIIYEPNTSKKPKANGYTFLGYFKDAACTLPLTFPYELTEQDIADYSQNAATNPEYNMPIYTKWLQGEYTLISKARDLASISGSTNYYFMVDELDMEGQSISFGANYSGKIVGNGCVIKNLKLDVDQKRNTINHNAMFKNLVGAKISDLTFRDTGVI